MGTRTDSHATLPVWSYLPLAMLGAGVVLWRGGAVDPSPPVEAPALLAPAQNIVSDGPGAASDAAAPVFEEPAVDTEVDVPAAHEDPAASADPDVRAEALAMRVALDAEWVGDSSVLPD
jgi:hypothetical protein